MNLDEYKKQLADSWDIEKVSKELVLEYITAAYELGYAQSLRETNEKARGIQIEPSWSQVRQLSQLVGKCHYEVSRNDIIKAWVRDWTKHKLGLVTYKEVFDR
jgi:hypothetical protein